MKQYLNIDIPKRHNQCSHADEALLPGREMYSAIFEQEELFLRKDYCPTCWLQLQGEDEMRAAAATWKSLVPEKIEIKEHFLDRESKAMALLQQFRVSEKEEEIEQAAILALYLARRRKLFQRGEKVNLLGKEMHLFEVAQTAEIIAVQKVDLRRLDLQKIQKLIAEKLKP